MGAALPNAAEDAYEQTVKGPTGFTPPTADSLSVAFADLEIIELIGQGGMGAVYRARQTKLDRITALKIVRPDNAEDPGFNERFEREARALAKLNHPGIVGIHDFGDVRLQSDDGGATTVFYFLMEFVEGVSLRQLMQAEKLTPKQALPIVQQICEALQYAHSQGVVHRDIKPENILVDAAGAVKIADFGLAKINDAAENINLTGTRQVLGTIQYMAPEQMSQSKAVDHRADIYSIGVVVYELLTGEVPVGVIEPPSQRAGTDHRLDEIVMKALAADPDKRFQTAEEVGTSISRISVPDAAVFIDQGDYVPGPSTILEDGVAAMAAAVRRILPGGNDPEHLGTGAATISIEDAEIGNTPDVCVVCGCATRGRVSKEFQAKNFFGVITKRVQAALPVCNRHRWHWSLMYWWAGLGWLFIPVGVFTGLLGSGMVGSIPWEPGPLPDWMELVFCILAGLAAYLIPLVRMATTRVSATNVSDTAISLHRVSLKFARACRQQK